MGAAPIVTTYEYKSQNYKEKKMKFRKKPIRGGGAVDSTINWGCG